MIKKILIGILIIAIPLGSGFYFLGLKKLFAPRNVAIDREVFEQSKAYVHGKIEHLQRLRLNYELGNERHRQAIRNIVLTETSTVDLNRFPVGLAKWVKSLKGVE